MFQLYQAEWCPYSHRVRQRLTELGIDYVTRQVAADRERRDELEAATGARSIPALLLDNGTAMSDTQQILAYLDGLDAEDEESARHRERAAAHGD